MAVTRIAIVGNRGGGKSTLAHRLAITRGLVHVEIDGWLKRAGARRTALTAYDADHARLIAQDSWLIDGLGTQDSIPARLGRATEVILVDLPLWMHAAFGADQAFTWRTATLGRSDRSPFALLEEIERTRMPEIRRLCSEAEQRGTVVLRLESAEALERFTAAL